MLYLFSSFDGIIINITTDILNESYKSEVGLPLTKFT
jgi:hypothetical protein